MKSITGYTVSALMKESGKSRSAIESFISRHGIEPLSTEALYPVETLDMLLKAKRGRPKKKGSAETSREPRKQKGQNGQTIKHHP